MTAVTADDIDDLNQLSDDDFRMLVRRWIEANYPPEIRNPPSRLHYKDTKVWYHKLARKGWLCLNWPREFGGMGITAGKQLIMLEEKERHGCARLNEMGMTMLGPLLIRHGTKEQQDYYLPKILTGEHIWCQGYSEPNAGSDLASLRTEAVPDGDHWVVNGQKIWTSMAMDANWIFLLVRTDKQAKKQEGISFLLVPMDSPGVTVRPITNIDMENEFCETFFDNVRVPKGNLVGQINKGWTMAKNLGVRTHRLRLAAPVFLCAGAAAPAGRSHGRLGGGVVPGPLYPAAPRTGGPQGAVQRICRKSVSRRGAGSGRIDAEGEPDRTVPAYH
jgi:hypothetical protein